MRLKSCRQQPMRDLPSERARYSRPKAAACLSHRRADRLSMGNEMEQELPVDVPPAIIR
jgi:hypothetical protein